jgi:aminoglycoside phosphotransferase (APT) family kinase protein
VDEAARLHGPRWGDPTLLDHAWLAQGVEAGPGLADLYEYAWEPFVERYGARLEPTALEVGRELREGIRRWVQHRPPALTLVHGDYRLDNMLFGPRMVPASRPLTVVDWQTVRLGCGTLDVAYFLGAGLDVTTRRAHEHDLVARYHAALQAYAVPDYPFAACWEDYRRFSYSGYFMAVIASILVGRTDRGDDMFMAMANRHATQITDLAANELL